MSSDRDRPSQVARRFAQLGTTLFMVVIAAFALLHATTFGVTAGPWGWTTARGPLLVNATLFTLFAMHHSVFARLGVKRWLDQTLQPGLTRAVYVWVSSLLFAATLAGWQPVPGVAWTVSGAWAWVLHALQVVGVGVVIDSARRLDLAEFLGLRAPAGPASFADVTRSGLYGVVRHPIYLGWMLMVWATPSMTGTRLAFAVISSAYLVLAIPFEERSLRASMGEAYRRYVAEVRWRVVPFVY